MHASTHFGKLLFFFIVVTFPLGPKSQPRRFMQVRPGTPPCFKASLMGQEVPGKSLRRQQVARRNHSEGTSEARRAPAPSGLQRETPEGLEERAGVTSVGQAAPGPARASLGAPRSSR